MNPHEKGKKPSGQPNCLKCRHFYVTYEPRHPRGCKGYGFKSREMPSRVVFTGSGTACRLFAPRS